MRNVLWIEQLRKQLGEENEKQQRVEDKLELMITQVPNLPGPMKIGELIAYPDWDGDIWEDSD